MTCDITNALRGAFDIAIQQPSLLGLNPYKVFVITILNSGVDIFGNGGVRTRINTRLTIGPVGYDATLNGPNQDGYISPHFKQVDAKDIFLSGGRLSDKHFRLGPIVPPYISCSTGLPAGTDIELTNPIEVDGENVQLFFKAIGPGLPADGQYFRRIWSKEDSNYCYYIYLEATGEIPQ